MVIPTYYHAPSYPERGVCARRADDQTSHLFSYPHRACGRINRCAPFAS
jgi:hypothetical protein